MQLFNTFSVGASIAHKNFKKMVRENILGFLWIFITPIIYSIFFLLIKQSLGGESTEPGVLKDSALNAFIGLILLQLWFQIIQDTTNIIRRNRGTLRALNINVYPFLAAVLIESIIHLCIRVLIITTALLIFDFSISSTAQQTIYLFAICFITYISSAIFIGLLLAPWSSLFNDIRNMLSSALMPVALLSPIFYFPVNNAETFLYWINQIIPFAAILAVLSEILFGTSELYQTSLFCWCIVSILGGVILAIMLKHQTPILLERLGS